MKNIFYLLAAFTAFSSCSSTELVTLSVVEPAPVTVPTDIKRIVVIDRTGTNGQKRAVDVVDKIFSLEGAELDKEGAKAATAGMRDELTRNDRFDEVISYRNANSQPGRK